MFFVLLINVFLCIKKVDLVLLKFKDLVFIIDFLDCKFCYISENFYFIKTKSNCFIMNFVVNNSEIIIRPLQEIFKKIIF